MPYYYYLLFFYDIYSHLHNLANPQDAFIVYLFVLVIMEI